MDSEGGRAWEKGHKNEVNTLTAASRYRAAASPCPAYERHNISGLHRTVGPVSAAPPGRLRAG
ncbi:hypothetical protein CHU32_24015 [Superficieibacter electus]|uniref:Uncharacterized protein n=1 Tax=Superficieibacter electus TaxID=2022662 RepID=A0A2P5GIG2_9ENTR|nr:hypothetical protein [Superficieibacter electus]POP41035.1 hypothetical protein CHU33_24465 [Superficieibacter electus]POP42929.1 hypothetical protein CHU32_24015 [Superficieibacter electus]